MVWEDQSFDELLKYKLPNVQRNVELGTEGGTKEQGLSVAEYYNTLFEILEEKLLLNVELDEKQEFDMYKWVWTGDRMAEFPSEPSVHSPAKSPP